MKSCPQRAYTKFRRILSHCLAIAFVFFAVCAAAEPLRIAYTSIAVVYGPLWLTKEAGIPAEVLASLPSTEEILAKAEAAKLRAQAALEKAVPSQ